MITDKPFLWTDGSEVEYIDWGAGEPNNMGGSQHCVGVVRNAEVYSWDDETCSRTFPFVCKVLKRM